MAIKIIMINPDHQQVFRNQNKKYEVKYIFEDIFFQFKKLNIT